MYLTPYLNGFGFKWPCCVLKANSVMRELITVWVPPMIWEVAIITGILSVLIVMTVEVVTRCPALSYTVTKVNRLFRASARMSVIKLFLARKMIYFCGLNKTVCQPGVLQGFLKTRLVYLFPCWNFPRNSTSPARNILKLLGVQYLFPDRTFPGMFSFPAWNYPGLSGISKQEKSASSWIRSTDLLDNKQISYLYTTNSAEHLLPRTIFWFMIIILQTKNLYYFLIMLF